MWWQAQLQEFAQTHSHTLWHPQDNYYGMMLFSRFELIEPQVKFLVQDDVPSIHSQVRLGNGRTIHLHCMHPRPPVPNGENERSTERDAELLIVGRQVANADVPAVVLGDLNDVAWSYTTHLFERISGLLDPRVDEVFTIRSMHAISCSVFHLTIFFILNIFGWWTSNVYQLSARIIFPCSSS